MTVVTECQRSGRDSTPPIEMGMPNGIRFVGLEEGPDDDMNFTMRRLFFENDVSLMSSHFFPNILGSTFPNLPLVLYDNPGYFFSKLINVIKVHSVHATYKDGIISSINSNSKTSLQGSSQPSS